jgi:uncharacterized protein DUF6152
MVGKVVWVAVAVGLSVSVTAIPARAHHSFPAVFDADSLVTVQGVIAEIKLANPHSWFYIDVTDATGKVVRWGFEGATPTSLVRSGVKPGTFKVGDQVTVKGCHARDTSVNIGAAREIVLADGRSFIVGPKGNEPN